MPEFSERLEWENGKMDRGVNELQVVNSSGDLTEEKSFGIIWNTTARLESLAADPKT